MTSGRNAITIERRRAIKADLRGDGSVVGNLVPQGPGREYVTVVLGDIKRGAPVSMADVRDQLHHLRLLACEWAPVAEPNGEEPTDPDLTEAQARARELGEVPL